MNMRLTTVLLAAVALSLTGCGAGETGGEPSDSPANGSTTVPVAASTNVYGALASAVGGEHVTVTSIINSPDADPHEYETTPKDALAVSQAKLFIVNGGGYDDFADQLLAASAAQPAVINASELSGRQAEPEFNEHVWYDLPTMARLTDRLAADLGTADPVNADAYRANAASVKAQLDELTGKLAAIKAAQPGARVAITEPVPLYLIEAAGLTNATPEEFAHAAEEGNDPPAAVLNETLALFSGPDPVRALIINPQAESAATKQVERAATSAGVPVVKMTETLPPGTMDYVTWMGGQVDQLAGALDAR